MDRDIVSFGEGGCVLVIDLDGWNGDPEQIRGAEQEFLDVVADRVVRAIGESDLEAAFAAEWERRYERFETRLDAVDAVDIDRLHADMGW